MNTSKLTLAIALIFIGLCFNACDEGEPLSKEDAKNKIDASALSLTSTVADINNTDGIKIQKHFFSIAPTKKGNISQNLPYQNIINKLSSIGCKKSINNIDFDISDYFELFDINFAANLGVWTYNDNEWVFTESSNNVEYIFPYENGTAIITYYDFAEGNEFFPFGLKTKIEYDDELVYNASFDASFSETEIAKNYNIEFDSYIITRIESYSIGLLGIRCSITSYLEQDGTSVYRDEIQTNITPSNANLDDFNISIHSTVTIDEIEFRLKFIFLLSNFNEDAETTFMENSNMSIYTTDNNKIGHFEFSNDHELQFYYTDGSMVDPYIEFALVIDIYENFIDDVIDGFLPDFLIELIENF